MISEKALKAAAAEVNELGVDPPIDLKAGVKKITAGLKEAIADVLEKDDEFSKETEKVLIELGWNKEEEEEEEEEQEEVEETEEEEEEEEQEEDDDDEEEKEEKQKVAEKIHQKNIASKAPIIKEDKGGKEKPAAPKEKRTPPPRKTGSYTRIDAVCDALKTKKPKTVKDWVKATNEVYIEKGGSANDSESSMMIKYASKVMTHFDVKFPTE